MLILHIVLLFLKTGMVFESVPCSYVELVRIFILHVMRDLSCLKNWS